MKKTFEQDGITSEAIFSECERYRYSLTRIWDAARPRVLFIGLNPSTADEVKNDPTVARMMNYARAWGFGSFTVCNVFGYRATLPCDMKAQDDPVGAHNNDVIVVETARAQRIVCAWGNHALFRNRSVDVLKLLKGKELFCLGVNQNGEPKHPLYLRKDTTPLRFNC